MYVLAEIMDKPGSDRSGTPNDSTSHRSHLGRNGQRSQEHLYKVLVIGDFGVGE